ncbi:MAG: hypothetical protein QME46_04755 [Thermoanaerobacteraceae bacterium]|nr:hypothetical protein [Thermoanaerobacteraceae bacterium]
MGTFNKFLMFILAVVAVVAAIALLVLGSGAVSADALSILSSPQWSMTIIIVGIVVIVVGGIALIMAFSKSGQVPKSASTGSISYMTRPTSGTRRQTNNEFITIPASYGDIKVSYETVRNLVERAAISVEELKTTGINVGKKEDNVYLVIDVIAAPDLNIPETVERLQKTVREYLENTVSLSIGDIEVNVYNITSTYRKRADSFQG